MPAMQYNVCNILSPDNQTISTAAGQRSKVLFCMVALCSCFLVLSKSGSRDLRETLPLEVCNTY